MKIRISLIIIMLFFSSCQEKTEQLLAKKWKISFEKTFEQLSEKQQKAFKVLPESDFLKQKKSLEKSRFILKENHTFEIKGYDNEGLKEGTWELNEDERKLILKGLQKKTFFYIETVEEEVLILSTQNSKQNIKFVLVPA